MKIKHMEETLNMTFGMELELSDVDRRVDIPEELGSWEGPKIGEYYMGSEIDIVNTRGKWAGVGTDPLAVNCTVGGEIHTVPTESVEEQLAVVSNILDLFQEVGAGAVNHGHIHVGFQDELTLGDIKNIYQYVSDNEQDTINLCYTIYPDTLVKLGTFGVPFWVRTYLQFDGGRSIDPELYPKVQRATTVEELMDIVRNTTCTETEVNALGTVVERRPCCSRRTAINLFNLTKSSTVEFRCFRSSVNLLEIYSSLVFVERFMQEALKGAKGIPVREFVKEYNFQFPKLVLDRKQLLGWAETRGTKERGRFFKKSSVLMEPCMLVHTDSDLEDLIDLIDRAVRPELGKK